MPTTNILDELTWRGLVYAHTEGLPDLLSQGNTTVYNGFDPTSDSLQVGNLLALMGLARLQRFGHTPIALAGGGTGLVGDPSGKAHERQLLSIADVEANVAAIKVQLASILDFEVKSNPAQVMNNADWLVKLNLMEFLRDIGKHFTVNYMVAKDSVKARLEDEGGISYTEFTYMLLQSYDFLHLYDHEGCRLQAGGSDQWGNITAGAELIRRMRQERAHGLVYPLVTGSDGTKLGKTEKGAIYLSPQRTSPYRFYQFWYNQGDSDVIQLLKYFTWLDQAEIAELEVDLTVHPEERKAQRRLAQEVTRMVHGESALAQAEQAAQVLFGGELDGLDVAEILDIFADVPSSSLVKSRLEGDGMLVVDLMVETGVTASKGEARRLVSNGGAYLNNRRIDESGINVTLGDALDGQVIVLRKGRKSYHLVKIV